MLKVDFAHTPALHVCAKQAALECLLDEKAELVTRTVDLENRLHEAEAAATKAAATAAAASRGTSVSTAATAFESSLSAAAEQGCESNDAAACQHSEENDTTATKSTSTDDNPSGRTERVGAEDSVRHQHQHQPTSLLLRQAEITASRWRSEADHLRGELETARAEKEQVIAAATEEIRASARRASELEVAIEETKREYQSHRDKAESRLETLRVAFDQENEENCAQVSDVQSSGARLLLLWNGRMVASSPPPCCIVALVGPIGLCVDYKNLLRFETLLGCCVKKQRAAVAPSSICTLLYLSALHDHHLK